MSRSADVEPPKQARSRKSYNRILEATADLLADRPFDEITVDEIVDRAGYTKGAFYHRFESKAVLLRHLVSRLTAGALDEWEEFLDPDSWEGTSLRDFLDAFVHRLVTIYSRSTHLMRVFAYEARWGSDEALRESRARLNRPVLRGLETMVTARADELAPEVRDDPSEALRFWTTALVSLLSAVYLWPDPVMGPDPDPEEVVERARRLLVPYLTG